ncbi:hypothetical protein CEXT_273901 [Caerostris extrusa]|uniref:Uncharacterized protein n=1 Tax=Caerostris extrusa TaxID=172846 RepID=A0AAV4NRN2_CAEEX|nr:hypothetical protein CEXT_273901 [Caerostris extrusa]
MFALFPESSLIPRLHVIDVVFYILSVFSRPALVLHLHLAPPSPWADSLTAGEKRHYKFRWILAGGRQTDFLRAAQKMGDFCHVWARAAVNKQGARSDGKGYLFPGRVVFHATKRKISCFYSDTKYNGLNTMFHLF